MNIFTKSSLPIAVTTEVGALLDGDKTNFRISVELTDCFVENTVAVFEVSFQLGAHVDIIWLMSSSFVLYAKAV